VKILLRAWYRELATLQVMISRGDRRGLCEQWHWRVWLVTLDGYGVYGKSETGVAWLVGQLHHSGLDNWRVGEVAASGTYVRV